MFYEIMIAQKVLYAAARQLLYVYLFSNLEASRCIKSRLPWHTAYFMQMPLSCQELCYVRHNVPLLFAFFEGGTDRAGGVYP